MKYFGTDGIRGTYGDAHIREPFFYALGRAAAEWVAENFGKDALIVVGGDTRASTDSLKAAFCRGVAAGNTAFFDAQVLPTPALPFCLLKKSAALGAMITASHNPFSDNGIKFFDSKGLKIDDETQTALEQKLEKYLDNAAYSPEKFEPRKIEAGAFAMNEYAAKMASIFPKDFLRGMKIAIDMANGATSRVSSGVLRAYGAEVFELSCDPDGFNINADAGSQHPEKIAEFCRKVGADAGFAHDGDGDRVVVVDETSSVLEGEEVLGLIAVDAKQRGVLKSGKIVTTLQSNLGLDESLSAEGIEVLRCGIGDRLVMRMMIENGCNVGGENSGHFIFSEISPCGDGLASALSVLSVMAQRGEKLSKLRGGVKMYPSVSRALKVERKTPVEQTQHLSAAIEKCNAILGGQGRLLVRYSGTEKKIRLLVEGKDPAKNAECMALLEKAVGIDLQ